MSDKGLPSEEQMFQAFMGRDSDFDGIFYTGVLTTGIYCLPSCYARKPKRKNVRFFKTTKAAQSSGLRACKLCKPDDNPGAEPVWIQALLDELNEHPPHRISDQGLRQRGLEPARVRRWFNSHHAMTFHAYQRSLRIGSAHEDLKARGKVTDTAFESGFESLSGFADAFKKITGQVPSKSGKVTLVKLKRLTTPLGPVFAGANDDGLCLLEFTDRKSLDKQITRLRRVLGAEFVVGEHIILAKLGKQLDEYFCGTRKEFSIPLNMAGTEFQRQAWRELHAIPYGETRSYQQQAERIGNPKAVRAVARANAQNAIAILLPCHRVVGKNGKLTGYAGGLWRKQHLLALEMNSGNEAFCLTGDRDAACMSRG